MELQKYLRDHFAKRTAHGYKLIIQQYCKQTAQPQQAKYKDVVSYLNRERSKGKKAATLLTILAAIKAYYDYLKKTGRRKDHPCKHLRLRDKIDNRVNVQDLI